jgi:hypothetical protein
MDVHMPILAYDSHHFFPGKQMMWFNSSMVGELITSMKLVPVNISAVQGKVVGAEHLAVTNVAAAIHAVDFNGTHGGIRALHLHFNNQIYLINEKQWAEISQKILMDVKAKLENAKEIGFEEGIILGSIFGG